MDSKKQKIVYSGLDVFKYIAACLIVVWHVVETDDVYACGVVYVFAKMSVPFFFITSGFLFGKGIKKANNTQEYFKNYLRRLGIMFSFWGVLVYGSLVARDYFVGQKDNGVLKNLVLWARRVFLIGPCAMWYVLALMISIVLIYLVFKKWNKKAVLIAVIACFGLNFIYINAKTLGLAIAPVELFIKAIDLLFSNSNNFIITGIPFTGLGFLISNYEIKINQKAAAVLFTLSTIINIAEYYCLLSFGKTITVGFIFQAISFFLLAISIKHRVNNSQKFRKASVVIYLLHWLLLYEVFNPILNALGIYPYQLWLLPIKTIAAIMLCTIAYVIIERINNKRLNLIMGL